MAWSVVLVAEVEDWYLSLDSPAASGVADALDQLEQDGPALRQPLVKPIRGSKLRNLKELRPGSAGDTRFRILFVFDPDRQAVLLVAGDKAGSWNAWYPKAVATAEDRYRRWLNGEYDERK